MFTINKGMAQGTTLKIDTGGFVFSCLFDSGAEISCMDMDTAAALGLLGKLTRSSVTVIWPMDRTWEWLVMYK